MSAKCKRCGLSCQKGVDAGGCGNIHFEFGYLMSAAEGVVKGNPGAMDNLRKVYGTISVFFPHLIDETPKATGEGS